MYRQDKQCHSDKWHQQDNCYKQDKHQKDKYQQDKQWEQHQQKINNQTINKTTLRTIQAISTTYIPTIQTTSRRQ